MGKGERTREAVLEQAVDLASVEGLDGLSIGGLAKHSGLSKSGLFAHFGSKEALQVAVLETTAQRFLDAVVTPARAETSGLARLRALFENWRDWDRGAIYAGGCPFVAASVELDDKPGPARDYLVWALRGLMDIIAHTVRKAQRQGEVRADVDAEQVAHDLYALMLGYHHAARLLRDPEAGTRAGNAFERLVRSIR